ncbi:MAG: class I SAM-dependent methyltransferase [Polyangiales bacterium]
MPPSDDTSRNAKAVGLLFRLWSSFYDNPVPQRLYYRRIHRRILDRWQPHAGERVLDVGCGTGLFLNDLAARFERLDLTGLDLSEHMLEQARRSAREGRSPAPRFVQGSVFEMPFESGVFDVALNTISCHFYLDQVSAFREIARVLKPRGRFFCAAITLGPFAKSAPMGNVAVYHPPRVIAEHLREAGFDVQSTEHIVPATVLFRAIKA